MNARAWSRMALLVATGIALVGCSSGGDNGYYGGTISLNGLWSGTFANSYLCEGGTSTLQLDIDEPTVTVSGGDGNVFPIGTGGTITEEGSLSYAIVLDVSGDVPGRFYTDPTREFALLVQFGDAIAADWGWVGMLERGPFPSVTYQESDLVGSWAGTNARVDADMKVTSTAPCSATITQPSGLAIAGSDGDGAFSGSDPAISLRSVDEGIYENSNQVFWGATGYDAVYALSSGKSTLAVGFMTTLCNGTPPFTILPSQKFGVWHKQ